MSKKNNMLSKCPHCGSSYIEVMDEYYEKGAHKEEGDKVEDVYVKEFQCVYCGTTFRHEEQIITFTDIFINEERYNHNIEVNIDYRALKKFDITTPEQCAKDLRKAPGQIAHLIKEFNDTEDNSVVFYVEAKSEQDLVKFKTYIAEGDKNGSGICNVINKIIAKAGDITKVDSMWIDAYGRLSITELND